MPNIIYPYIDVFNNTKTKLRDNIQYDKCIKLSKSYQETVGCSLNTICELINKNGSKNDLKK